MSEFPEINVTELNESLVIVENISASFKELEANAGVFSKTITKGLKSAATNGWQFEEVLRSIGKQYINIALNAGMAPLEKQIGQLTQNMFGTFGNLFKPLANSFAGAFSGQVVPFAKGGVVNSPTHFPMGSNVGLMGEAGPEAIIPLSRGADGSLGISSSGGQSPITINFNVSSPDAGGFLKSEAQISTLLARAVKRGQRGL